MARIKPQALLQQSKKKKGPSGISITTVVFYGLIVVFMVFFLVPTYRHWSQSHRSRVLMENDVSVLEDEEHENAFADAKNSDIPKYAILDTSKGSITVELYKEGSPKAVIDFVDSCRRGHFKGMLFHHVIKNFVIRGGRSDRPGVTEDWTLREKHNSLLDTSMKHEAFMLGTSKTKHDKEGFELFITTAPIPDLNEKLIVFGRVVKGEDVVQEIEEVDTDEHYRPKSPVTIIGVTLKHKV
ncbi:peptidyl-prolyl cis-trans isomerase CYP21-3, mitochondrial-like [Diospyros lotus]|uniref:peptidyl-prolyl cis-trans isomerase CYP21-3, mitochondrial-like n=1 Tax=Diospyros lotus TaxID=55363 RepID=UPI002257F819|nr:peptidyl-prolyl cis-trans isomerase CYP21-3, mitochondrial-like [Diospyros lotus]XP_052209898.1 peptidyl-prolyl cis-trans isomerase CYP21-3, mitochondrial-like [Diospyros lotus]XP_052209907.1 peptidyl-prolyl cis-trans isomerase CYP21-3, mitochondrial-like [Diospyros lotus]XP_052209916.1 peptidyl-prolyl cis-trans isomerase CYP21-3, mitochondrial-like [Diospyros lotus]